jgi:hypothetical protein
MPLLGDTLLRYIPRAIRKTGDFEELGVEGWPSSPRPTLFSVLENCIFGLFELSPWRCRS